VNQLINAIKHIARAYNTSEGFPDVMELPGLEAMQQECFSK
jgi:hypothetical protein